MKLISRLFRWVKADKKNFYLVFIFAGFFIQAFFYLFFLNTWFDETSYLYLGWLIYDRGWTPFTGMFMKLPPVIYYVFGFAQHFLGIGIYIGRLVSIIFGSLMLVALFKFSSKIGGKAAGLIAVGLIVSHPFSVATYSSATAYSLTAFFMMASLWALSSGLKSPWRPILSVLLMSLAILTRQDMGPAYIFLILYILLTENKKTIFYSLLSAIIFPLIILSPFLIKDFSQVVHQIFREAFLPPPFSVSQKNLISQFKMLFIIIRRYIVFFILLLSVIFAGFFGKNFERTAALLKKYKICVLTALMLISIFFLHIFGRSAPSYMEYVLYSLPFAASLIGIGMARIYLKLDSKTAKFFFIGILISSFIFSFVFLTTNFSLSFKDSDINRIKRAAEVLKLYTKSDDKIFTIDSPDKLLYAKRMVVSPPVADRGTYYTSSRDNKKVQEHFYYNREIVGQWLNGEAAAVVLQRDKWKMMMLESFDQELLDLIEKKLHENYVLAASVENAYPRKYTAGKGTMDIYLLKKK